MHDPTIRSLSLLQKALTANAVFSTLSAFIFIVAAGPLARLAGTRPMDLAATGVSLVLFAGMILLVLARFDFEKRWIRNLSWTIAGLDVLWVLTTPLNVIPFTPAGKALFTVIALVVGVFAVLQIKGILGATRQRTGSAAPKGA